MRLLLASAVIFILLANAAYALDINKTIQLTASFIGIQKLSGVAYDAKNNGFYFVGLPDCCYAVFGYYNANTQQFEDLSGTLPSSWSGRRLFDVAYDNITDGAYLIGGTSADRTVMFGHYRRAKNTTDNLDTTGDLSSINIKLISQVAFDYVNNGVYLATQDLGRASHVSYYNANTNRTEDLVPFAADNSCDGADHCAWEDVAFDNRHNGAYFGNQEGDVEHYFRQTNETINLKNILSGGGFTLRGAIAYDSINDGAYLSSDEVVEFYNFTSNASTPIFNSGSDIVSDIVYDNLNDGAFLLGNDEINNPAGEKLFYYFERRTSTFHNLINTDSSNPFITNIFAGTFDKTNNKLYFVGEAGMIGVYNSFLNRKANTAPAANAGPDKTAIANQPTTFDGSASYDPDGTIVSYDWNFGDGSTGTGVSPSHAYAAAGIYTVTLTVTDNDGAAASDTMAVNVLPPFQASITKHSVKATWNKNLKIGKVDAQISFVVNSGSSNNAIFKEITDGLGTWSLDSQFATVKINGAIRTMSVSLDANNDAVIDFGASGITLNAGDAVEITKLKLVNNQGGAHSLTSQILENGFVLASNTLNFSF